MYRSHAPEVFSGIGERLKRYLGNLRASFLGGSVEKNTSVKVGDASLILGLGRSPGERNGNPLQYSCL